MTTQKSSDGVSLKNALTSSEPITHFFYEYDGERVVDPMMLVDSGITLWHEHIYTNEAHDNSYLWKLASRLLDERQETPTHSWVEWLKFRITTGALVPDNWNKGKAFPYKGLFISAIYFQEAERLCAQGDRDRAWHIVTMAYYHLGLNTASSTQNNAARAAKMKHAAISEKMRAAVLGALDKIRLEGSANSVESAKNQVVELLRANQKKRPLADWLSEFDTLVAKSTKGKTEGTLKNDLFARVRNMLDDWSSPNGPYPDIAEAFSHFNKRRRNVAASGTNEGSSSAGVPVDGTEYYMRLISFMEDGRAVTVKVSEMAKEDAA